MKKRGFTLAEVLITLAIIGVVAAISIPSVISNSQQQEFKTGLRKAVSVLNSAITMNMAIDGESPYDNANLFGYLQKHMSVMKSTLTLSNILEIRMILPRLHNPVLTRCPENKQKRQSCTRVRTGSKPSAKPFVTR